MTSVVPNCIGCGKQNLNYKNAPFFCMISCGHAYCKVFDQKIEDTLIKYPDFKRTDIEEEKDFYLNYYKRDIERREAQQKQDIEKKRMISQVDDISEKDYDTKKKKLKEIVGEKDICSGYNFCQKCKARGIFDKKKCSCGSKNFCNFFGTQNQSRNKGYKGFEYTVKMCSHCINRGLYAIPRTDCI